MSDLSAAIAEYLDSRKARGIKPSTVVNERVVLKQLMAAVGNLQVKNLTSRHIDMYFTAYSHLSSGTWNRNIGYLSGFFKWCRARKYATRDFDPLEGISSRKVKPRDYIFLPPARFGELLDAARTPRDRAVLAIGLYTFQRASELTRLRWEDVDDTAVDPRHWKIAVYRVKTEDRDWLPMCLELRDELRRWKLTYGALTGETPRPEWYVVPAFAPGEWGQGPDGRLRLSRPLRLNPTRRYTAAHKAVQAALTNIGFIEMRQEGAHTLRRSGGKALYEELAWERGHDGALRIVQSMYGHANLTTTERYLRLTLERKRRNDLIAGASMFPDREGKVLEIAQTASRSAHL